MFSPDITLTHLGGGALYPPWVGVSPREAGRGGPSSRIFGGGARGGGAILPRIVLDEYDGGCCGGGRRSGELFP